MKKNIYLDFAYFIILASTFGAILVLGAVVAPVIFNNSEINGSMIMDHYNSGIVMGEIFRRFSYWIYFATTYVIVYEAIVYKMGSRDAISFASAVIVVSSGLLFSSVYVPKILDMQKLGQEATQSDTFENIHIASEIDFKILAFALIVLFVRRLMILRVPSK